LADCGVGGGGVSGVHPPRDTPHNGDQAGHVKNCVPAKVCADEAAQGQTHH